MCQMWQRIRYGVRWNPAERLALATRGLDLKTVKSIDISFDPFHSGNNSLRYAIFGVFYQFSDPLIEFSGTV